MSFQKPDTKYWDTKFAAYLHDPFDKAFAIKGHEERAAELLEIFGLDLPNEKYWKKADGIASGFERGQVPTYAKDVNKNGAVDFVQNGKSIITHPIGEEAKLEIDLSSVDISRIHKSLKSYLKHELGVEPETGGYSRKFVNQPDRFALARFLFTHLVLRFKLAQDDVAGLGALWHRLPADTRFPDHTIWQHNALTSALTSCMELAGDENSIGLMVFSITPVQEFISKARKLRDFWTGSVILSWLAFEGLRWVIENLGPDHVIYPSLIDQPLVNEYLKLNWHVDEEALTQTRNIASLPNKFVVLIPLNKAVQIGDEIKKAIMAAWKNFIGKAEQNIIATANLKSIPEIDHLTKLFKDQTETYWELQWAASKLVGGEDLKELIHLLPENAYTNQVKLLEILNKIIEGKNYQNSGRGTLYSVSHHLAQSALAAQKLQRHNQRPAQNGEKCSMCGEFEALHSIPHLDGQKASEYAQNVKNFWNIIRQKTGEKEIKENEHLCAICYVKRMGYRIFKQNDEHILAATFKNAESFPSTTQIALKRWCKNNKIDKIKCSVIADKLHEQEDKNEITNIGSYNFNNGDKYYAILMMDGDRMGKLINGETISATWKSIMHPEIVKRLESKSFDSLFHNNWMEIFKNYPKRFITPSIHAAISEALADFSIYGVKPIIEEYDGRLIYAGGDDVCAILPWQNVVEAARRIREFYIGDFKLINKESLAEEKKDLFSSWEIEPGKLSVLLGKGENISISAAIVIAHHKDNLGLLIKRAHELLDGIAKKKMGRDTLAIELKKRSGGSRIFAAKWHDIKWQSFSAVQTALSKSSSDLSRSLLYKINLYKDGVSALIKKENLQALKAFIATLLQKSENSKEIKKNDMENLAANIARLIDMEDNALLTDSLIIASFLARKEAK